MTESPVRLHLRSIRESHGLTHHALAEKIGVTQSYISQIESGARTPSLPMLARIAHALNVPIRDLIDERPCPGCPYWQHVTGETEAPLNVLIPAPANGLTNGHAHNYTLEEVATLDLLRQTAWRLLRRSREALHGTQPRLGRLGQLSEWVVIGRMAAPW